MSPLLTYLLYHGAWESHEILKEALAAGFKRNDDAGVTLRKIDCVNLRIEIGRAHV
jgi:hypothetical protein